MTQHATYTERFLIKKGLSYCKTVALELGAVPSGDKRQLATWIGAIIKHQGSNSQPVEVEATIRASIEYDDTQLTEPYLVMVDGEMVHQRDTYMNACRYVQFQGYKLVDPTEVAQSELEAQAHERGEELQFVSPDGFSEYLAYEKGVMVSRISYLAYEKGVMVGRISRDVSSDDTKWVGEVSYSEKRFEFYDDAEEFVKNNHLGKLDERGSGRVSDEGVSIEDVCFVDDRGQQYDVRVHRILAGYIWLIDEKGWTADGETFNDDWRPIANQVIKMTKHEYLLAD